jgi:hypothetical protein
MPKFKFMFYAEKTEVREMFVEVEATDLADAKRQISEESEWSFEPKIGPSHGAEWETISEVMPNPEHLQFANEDEDINQGIPGLDFPNYEEY